MAEEVLVVFSTWPELALARAAVRAIVEEKLAACGTILPGAESIYHWQGKVETSAEVLVIWKTTIGCYPRLEQRIRALHPYEVPEIVTVLATDGLPAYLRWVESTCAS